MKTKKNLRLKHRGGTGQGLTVAQKDARFIAVRTSIEQRLKGRSIANGHHGVPAGTLPHARIVGLGERAARVDARGSRTQ
jgi:hypothetical protein